MMCIEYKILSGELQKFFLEFYLVYKNVFEISTTHTEKVLENANFRKVK